jgi:predicted metal-dependent hydrolase
VDGAATRGEPLAPELAEFLALYAAGRYFDAHEALELSWRRSRDPRMLFYQGLIQWAVAFEHRRRGNPRGARRQLAKAWAKLAPAPPGYLGLDLSACRAAQPALAAALARWEDGGPAPSAPAPAIAALPAAQTAADAGAGAAQR